MKLTSKISSEQFAEYERVFNLFDVNGNGSISQQEMTEALEVLGTGISQDDLANLLERMQETGVVSKAEFIDWMICRKDLDVTADLRKIFDLIDVDKSGKLSIHEFAQIIRCFNTTASDADIETFFQKTDLDGSGELDFEEFLASQALESNLRITIAGLRSFKKILLQYAKVAEISSIALIEVDSELGAGTRGQSLGTTALRQAAIQKQIARMHAENGILSLDGLRVQTENWAGTLANRHPHAKYIDRLYQVLSRTTDLVAETLRSGKFPVVLGGDHSTAAGTIAGIKQAYPDCRLGVVWIDAHADIHSPFTTPSGNMHGMPLAIATATDNLEKQLNSIDSNTADLWHLCKSLGLAHDSNLNFSDLVYVAVRDTEEAENHLLNTHQIPNMTTARFRELGAANVAQWCLDKLNGVDLIYVSFDVDSMDSTVCMGTGTPSPGGLFVDEVRLLNQLLVKDPRVCCWEICEINPLLDTLNTMVENSLSIFQDVVEVLGDRLELRVVQ